MLDAMEYGEIGTNQYWQNRKPCCLVGHVVTLHGYDFVEYRFEGRLERELNQLLDEVGAQPGNIVTRRNDNATPEQRLAAWELYLTRHGYTIEDIGGGRKRASRGSR